MRRHTIVRGTMGVAVVLALSSQTACGAMKGIVPGEDPFLAQSPRSIAKAASAEMRDVGSIRILGAQESKRTGFTRIDVRLDETRCSGSLDTADGVISIRRNATGAWFSADADFWRAKTGSSPRTDKVIRSYAGKWSRIKPQHALLDLCDFNRLLKSFAMEVEDTKESVDGGEVVRIGDSDAVPVTGQDGKKRVTVWVSVDAPHHVLKLAPTRDASRPDELYFEEFGAKVVVETPDAEDVVELPAP